MVPEVSASGRRSTAGQSAERAPSRQSAVDEMERDRPWFGVAWSLALIAFMVYCAVIITYAIHVGTEAMVAALVGVLLLREPKRMPVFLVLFGLWVVWCFVVVTSSRLPATAWDSALEHGKLLLIAFVAVNVLQGRRNVRFFTFFFLTLFALYPLRGVLFSFFLYHASVMGRAAWNYIFANPNDLAAFTLLPLSLTLGLLLRERVRFWRTTLIVGLVLLPLAILTTQSRQGFLGMSLFLLLALGGQAKRLRFLLWVGAIAALVLLLAPDDVMRRVKGLRYATNTEELGQVDPEGSAKQRFEIWKVAVAMIAANPVMGVGTGVYGATHQLYVASGRFDQIAAGPRDTHSTYLNVAAETGLVGLILFLGAIAACFREAEVVRRRVRHLLPRAALQLWYIEAAFLGYMVCMIWGSYGRVPFTILHLCFMYAYAREAAATHALIGSTSSHAFRSR